jgi:hypothetical protein
MINRLVHRDSGRCQGRPFGHNPKLRDVRTCLEIDTQFRFVARLHVVLREPAANLTGDAAYYMVGVCVVVGGSRENVDSDVSFFEFFGPAFQRTVDDMPQQTGISTAVPKNRTGKNSLCLLADRIAIQVIAMTIPVPLTVDSLEDWLGQSRTRHEDPLVFNWQEVYHNQHDPSRTGWDT